VPSQRPLALLPINCLVVARSSAFHPSSMVRHISSDVKEVALSMCLQGLSDSAIRQYTGIGRRSMTRFRTAYHNNALPSLLPLEFGRPRMLNAIQVKVCLLFFHPGSHLTGTQYLCDVVARQPDMSLAELKAEIFEIYTVDVSMQTVWRCLQREGYTMKIVSFHSSFCPHQPHSKNNRPHVPLLSEMSKIMRSTRPSSLPISARSSSSSQTRVTSIDSL
jgi:transposase